MVKGAPLPPETVREIARRVAGKQGIAQIKREMPGVSDASIRNYFARFAAANGNAPAAAEELLRTRGQRVERPAETKPDTVREIRILRRERNMRPTDIAAKLGVSVSSVYKYLRDEPDKAAVAAVVEELRDEQAEANLRRRLLRQIVEFGPYNSVRQLTEDIRIPGEKPVDEHAVTSVLMNGLGRNRNGEGALIRFTEHLSNRRHAGRGARGNNSPLTRIEATPAGYRAAGYPDGFTRHNGRPGDGTDFRNQPGRAPGGPVEVFRVRPAEAAELAPVPPPEPEPEAAPEPEPDALDEPVAEPVREATPLLDRLRARQAESATAVKKSHALLDAAALLEETSPEESARLEALAEQLAGEPFTALEIEYLRYAEAHP